MEFIGVGLVVGIVALIVVCVMLDKKGNKKFQETFSKEHTVKEACGDCFISNEGELVKQLNSGSLVGYKVWKLSDISYIAIGIREKGGQRSFSILDSDKKAMKGNYMTPSRKPLKEYGYESFTVAGGDVADLAEMLIRNAPHIERL